MEENCDVCSTIRCFELGMEFEDRVRDIYENYGQDHLSYTDRVDIDDKLDGLDVLAERIDMHCYSRHPPDRRHASNLVRNIREANDDSLNRNMVFDAVESVLEHLKGKPRYDLK